MRQEDQYLSLSLSLWPLVAESLPGSVNEFQREETYNQLWNPVNRTDGLSCLSVGLQLLFPDLNGCVHSIVFRCDIQSF